MNSIVSAVKQIPPLLEQLLHMDLHEMKVSDARKTSWRDILGEI